MTLGELRDRIEEILRIHPAADLAPVYLDGVGYYDDWIDIQTVDMHGQGVVLVTPVYEAAALGAPRVGGPRVKATP